MLTHSSSCKVALRLQRKKSPLSFSKTPFSSSSIFFCKPCHSFPRFISGCLRLARLRRSRIVRNYLFTIKSTVMMFVGRITKDAVVNQLKDERKVVNFTIALNDFYKPKGSEK